MAYDGSIKIQTIVDTKGFKSGRDEIESGLSSIKSSLKSLASVIGLTFGAAAVVDFGKSSVAAASELSNALQGLESIVEGQGRSFSQAQAFIQDYISDGLVPAANAVTAYKNLAARGYDDTQIQQVMTALKDSAAYGRQASLSMGEAIQSASEGLKNENSILVDNAGVTKNVSIMWKDYAQSIGKGVDSLTQYEKIQAEVNGILSETRFQTGDAAKVAQSYSGQVSQLTFNFNNLKVAIGNALIPIVQAILPHINAMLSSLTEVATVAGQVVSILFGTQSQKQEEIATTATKAAKSENNLAKATTAAAKAAKAAASGFDELNIVQSQQSGGTAGNDDTNIITPSTDDTASGNALQDASKVSQEAKRIAEKIQKFIADVKKALNDFSPILEGIATGFLAAFGFKWISSAITKARKLPIISNLIDGISAAAAAVTTEFKNTGKLFPSLKSGLQAFRNSLTKTQKAMLGVAGAVVVFTTTKEAIKKLELGSMDLSTALKNIIPICTAVGVALYAVMGPIGPLIAAIAGVAGAIVGYNEAQKELQQQKTDEYFSGVALSAEDLSGILSPMTEQFNVLSEAISNHKSAAENLKNEYDTASQSLDMVYTQLEAGTETVPGYAETIYNGLMSLADTLRTATDEDTQYYYAAWQETFNQAGTLTQEESASILNDIVQLGSDKKSEIDRIEDEITAIHTAAKERNVGQTVTYTQEELAKLKGFQDDLDALMAIERNKEAKKAEIESAQLYEDIKTGRLKVTDETYQELLDTIQTNEDESVRIAKENQAEMLADAESYWESAKVLYKDNAEKLGEAEYNYIQMREQATESYKTALTEAANTANSTREMLKLGIEEDQRARQEAKDTLDEYNDAMLTLQQLQLKARDAAHNDKDERDQLNETIGEQKNKIEELGRELEENQYIVKDWKGTWTEENATLREELTKMVTDIDNSINNSVNNFVSYGVNSAQGLINGYRSKYQEIKDAAAKMYDESEKGVRESGAFGSPSRRMEQYGEWTGEGFINGIEIQRPAILSSFSSLFNAILDKTDTFCANFRTAINNMLTAMRSAVNGVSLSSGKISVTQMQPVQVPRLATGAVIPPRAEFLAVLGDQRSGRNIETPEALMRKVVREESGGASMALLERLVLLTEQLVAKDTTVKVAVDDREIAQAVAVGNRKLGYPIRG